MEYVLDWSVIWQNTGVLLTGMLLTLQISTLSLMLSIPIGVAAGLLKVSSRKFLSLPATWYIEFVRGVPLLVLLIWIYFALGKFLSLGAYWSAVWGLAVFSGAFVAEVVRAGIEAVPRGQMEAARSLGMTYVQAMKLIVLPQALRMVLPPMASQFIILIKDSSLVSVISVVDLTLVGKNLVATTFRSMEIWTAIAILYFLITSTLSQAIRMLERKYKIAQ